MASSVFMLEATQDRREYGIGEFCGKLENHFTFYWGWTVLTTYLQEDLYAFLRAPQP
jgi:hypothetical protein